MKLLVEKEMVIVEFSRSSKIELKYPLCSITPLNKVSIKDEITYFILTFNVGEKARVAISRF